MLFINSLNIYSQISSINIPLLISLNNDTINKHGKLIFVEDNIEDSIVGHITVVITFMNNIDKYGHLQIENIEIYSLKMLSTDINIDNPIKIDYSIFNSGIVLAGLEKQLFNRYSNIFKNIYKNQPYSEMKGREYYNVRKLSFGCPFLILSKNKAKDNISYPYFKKNN